jgi:hypothetical protein
MGEWHPGQNEKHRLQPHLKSVLQHFAVLRQQVPVDGAPQRALHMVYKSSWGDKEAYSSVF